LSAKIVFVGLDGAIGVPAKYQPILAVARLNQGTVF